MATIFVILSFSRFSDVRFDLTSHGLYLTLACVMG